MRLLNITLAISLFTFAGCQKQLAVDAVNSFGVNTDSTVYHAGSPVTFRLLGNPNTITFYSGEPGHRYPYQGRTSAAGTPTLQFTSALNAGTQPNSLLLLASTDFKGVAAGDTVTTIANLAAATWTDLTSRAKLATTATAVASGAIDLSDLVSAGKPIYLAFKYIAAAGSIQNKWTITGLTVTNTLKDGTTYTIANLAANNIPITSNYGGVNTFSPGWVAYTPANTFPWTVTAGTSLVVAGAATQALATANAEAWTLMGTLDLQKVTPDAGIAIKAITAAMPSYTYTYASPGYYNAVFVGANATKDKADSITRAISVAIQ